MFTLWRMVLSRRVITDKQANTASYIDSVESFAVPSFPYPFPPIVFSTVWHTDRLKATLEARFRIKQPDGKAIYTYEYPPTPMQAKRHRHNVQLGDCELTTTGEYQISVELRSGDRWKVVDSLKFEVEEIVSQTTPAKPSRRTKRRKKVTAA